MATLAQLAQQYLNQGLPSISGIFQPRADTPVEEPVEETISGITPQLLQPMGGGGGFNPYNINSNDPNVRTSRNYQPYNCFWTMMGILSKYCNRSSKSRFIWLLPRELPGSWLQQY